MKIVSKEQNELIDSIAAEGLAGRLTPFILEKDVHVTDALHALTKLQHKHVEFVFCGGTSLSKAHGLIERMSEDVDLKVVLSTDHGLSKSALKKHLSDVKNAAIGAMKALDLKMIECETLALNENRYFASGWKYETRYTAHASLRAHLRLEFTVRSPRFRTEQKPIGYLIDRLAHRQGTSVLMACIAVEETLAEKVLSFLRRHAEHRAGVRNQWDEALVRHIYDTYCIVESDPKSINRAAAHFKDLVEFDRQEFRNHGEFVADPKQCMAAALAIAETEPQTEHEYKKVLLPLIYGTTKPSFEQAFAVFKSAASTLLERL